MVKIKWTVKEMVRVSIFRSTDLRLQRIPPETEVYVIRDWKREAKRLTALHKVVNVVLRPPQECKLKGFVVKTVEVVKWNSVPLLV